MAGPTASILVPSPAYRAKVYARLLESFPGCDPKPIPVNDAAFDGWIDSRPFVVDCGWEYKREIEDFDFDGFRASFGWAPVDQIDIVAMCGEPIDHQLLARISIVLAQEYGGAINLHGRPEALSYDIARMFPGHFCMLQSLDSGVVMKMAPSVCCVDSLFLSAWSKHPSFRMVK